MWPEGRQDHCAVDPPVSTGGFLWMCLPDEAASGSERKQPAVTYTLRPEARQDLCAVDPPVSTGGFLCMSWSLPKRGGSQADELLPAARRRSWPQAASMREPLRRLTCTLIPACRRISRNRSREASLGSSQGRPATALYGMTLTKTARLPRSVAKCRACSAESLRLPSSTYSKVSRRPDACQ